MPQVEAASGLLHHQERNQITRLRESQEASVKKQNNKPVKLDRRKRKVEPTPLLNLPHLLLIQPLFLTLVQSLHSINNSKQVSNEQGTLHPDTPKHQSTLQLNANTPNSYNIYPIQAPQLHRELRFQQFLHPSETLFFDYHRPLPSLKSTHLLLVNFRTSSLHKIKVPSNHRDLLIGINLILLLLVR